MRIESSFEVVLDPLRVDQHVLRVVRHGSSSFSRIHQSTPGDYCCDPQWNEPRFAPSPAAQLDRFPMPRRSRSSPPRCPRSPSATARRWRWWPWPAPRDPPLPCGSASPRRSWPSRSRGRARSCAARWRRCPAAAGASGPSARSPTASTARWRSATRRASTCTCATARAASSTSAAWCRPRTRWWPAWRRCRARPRRACRKPAAKRELARWSRSCGRRRPPPPAARRAELASAIGWNVLLVVAIVLALASLALALAGALGAQF